MHMIEIRQIRGFVVAGVLSAAVAGCGTVVAATGSSTTGNNAGTTTSSGSTATGCSSTTLATKVTVIRAQHLVQPQRAAALEKTQTDPAKVQALFHQFCQAIAHKEVKTAILNCPDEVGLSYSGAFYDGSRLLADYVYGASGCQRVTVTAPGAKAQTVVIWGTAATAAPQLESDMGQVLGVPMSKVFPSGTRIQKEGATN